MHAAAERQEVRKTVEFLVAGMCLLTLEELHGRDGVLRRCVGAACRRSSSRRRNDGAWILLLAGTLYSSTGGWNVQRVRVAELIIVGTGQSRRRRGD